MGNEVVCDTCLEQDPFTHEKTLKFNISQVKRFRVTIKNTIALWEKYKSQFGQFMQFDWGQCTFGIPNQTARCNEVWQEYGSEVGCQPLPLGTSAYAGYWTSFPGRCPSMPFTAEAPQGGPTKTAECMESQPGGNCSAPNGPATCIWF